MVRANLRNVCITACLAMFVGYACGCASAKKKTGGKTTAPSGMVVHDKTKKSPAPAIKNDNKHTTSTASAACQADDVGQCGCLPPEDWFTDGTEIYDVVCCDAVGDTFTLYACGDESTCDDSGSAVVCQAL